VSEWMRRGKFTYAFPMSVIICSSGYRKVLMFFLCILFGLLMWNYSCFTELSALYWFC